MKRSTKILLGLILLLAAFIRIYAALNCEAEPDFSDMAIYNEAALEGGIPSYPPPGYPLFLRAVYAVAGPLNYGAVFLVQAIFSTVAVLLVFLTARNVFNERAGLFAALIAAVYPKFIAYNLTTMTESLSVLLAILTAWLVTSGRKPGLRSALSGIAVFTGFLIKPAFLFFVPGMLLASRRRLALIATLAVTFGSFFAYGTLTGKTEDRGPMMLYKAYNPLAAKTRYFEMEATELGAGGDVTGEEYMEAVTEFVTEERWMTFDIIFGKATVLVSRGWSTFVLQDAVGRDRFLNEYMSYAYLPVLVLGLLGMLRFGNKGTGRLTLMILSFAVFHILVTIFKMRYRLPIEPLLVVLAGIPLAAAPWGRLPDLQRMRSFAASIRRRTVASLRSGADSVSSAGRTLLSEIRGDLDLLGVIVLLSIALRAYFAFAMDVENLAQESLALNTLAIKGGFTSTDAPAYPLFLRAVYSLFGSNDFTAVFLIQGLLDSAGVVMLYIAAKRIWNGRAGLIAAAVAAVFPRFLVYCISVKVLSLGIFTVIALILILSLELRERTRGILSGAAVSLAVLLNPLYAYLVPGTALALGRSRKAFFLTLLVILAPLAVRNSAAEKELIPVYHHSAYALDFGKFDPPGHPKMLNAIYSNISNIMGRDWRDNYEREMDKGVRNFNYLSSYSYIAVLVLGLAALFRYGRRREMRCFLPVWFYILLLILLAQLQGRVQARVLLEPVLIAYTARLFIRSAGDESPGPPAAA